MKEERKRIGITQADAAARAGVARETWSRYENGALPPTLEAFSAIAAAGADIQYIVTGVRSAQALTRDEIELLEAFRAAPLAVKAAAIGALQGGSHPPSVKQSAKVRQTGAKNQFKQSQGGTHDIGKAEGKRKG